MTTFVEYLSTRKKTFNMEQTEKGHVNHMNGISYIADDPLLELEAVLYSAFLHEPSFYNPAKDKDIDFYKKSGQSSLSVIENNLQEFLLFPLHGMKSRQRIFYEVANKALEYNFEKTLELAVKARTEFFMRSSPCELIAIAAAHSDRPNFNKNYEGFFRQIVKKVCIIPPDMISILDSWKSLKGSKKGFPNILKAGFRDVIKDLTPYHMNKYRRACIDAIQISNMEHTDTMKELLKRGKVHVEEQDRPWETLMCSYGCWKKTLETLQWKMPHMAALRNIRGFAIKVRNSELLQKYCDMLEGGVIGGKQFPFQYLSAYESVVNASKPFVGKKQVYYKKSIRKQDVDIIKKCLENCIQISIQNHPSLEGDTMIMSDNSGSAWGQCPSTFGTRKIAELGNLSALITGLSCSGKATIGLFGDTLIEYEVDKTKSFFENYYKIQELVGKEGKNVGGATENGLWLFFKRAMLNPEKYRYDNFFCYSDMQAGHGGLFGNDPEMDDKWVWMEKELRYCNKRQKFIHLPKLFEHYRQTINPRINVFTVQTAGYNDSILPQSCKRHDFLSGWTGREGVFAKNKIDLWNRLNL